eukprot:12894722-Prorocentrum_lima.AAC.1
MSDDSRGLAVRMESYVEVLKPVAISTAHCKDLHRDRTPEEAKELLRVSGEIGWLGRQCQLDL